MPSALVGNASGGTNLFSGWWGAAFSGTAPKPYAQIYLKADVSAGGLIYVALSGGVTVNSGGLSTSGGPTGSGLLDGYQLRPGDEYRIPRLGFAVSGVPQIFARSDAGNSGVARLFFEVF